MKKRLIWPLYLLILLILMYEVVFRTKTVTYIGEDKNWFIKIHAELADLNASNSIEVRYKGKKSVEIVDFNISPQHYMGSSILNGKDY